MNDSKAILLLGEIHKSFAASTYLTDDSSDLPGRRRYSRDAFHAEGDRGIRQKEARDGST